MFLHLQITERKMALMRIVFFFFVFVVLQVELKFQAQFFFSAGNLYRPPPLLVNTLLTTESAQGEIRGGQGSRLDSKGNCRLVGVARLAPIDDLFMSTFLTLPSDCLADLSANFAFFT
jgi:hypothetical protein